MGRTWESPEYKIISKMNDASSKQMRDINSAIVVIHFHYPESIDDYMPYILNIPDEVDILFTTSNIEIKSAIEAIIPKINNKTGVVLKENRGRDVSSLLIAAKQEILKRDIFCFIHDKKGHNNEEFLKAKNFAYCLWENCLGSELYIKSILGDFENDRKLGLVMPPLPFSREDNFRFIYENNWYRDYENTISLAKKIGLNPDISYKFAPLSVGTAFWARTDALNKLLKMDWKYEDFDEEPLANDGTISHAVEKIIAFVAEDSGYKTVIAMTEEYAAEWGPAIQESLYKAFEILRLSGISYTHEEVDRQLKEVDQLKDFVSGKKVYIYGAGMIGEKAYRMLRNLKADIGGFIVSSRVNNPDHIGEYKVYEADEINDDTDYVIIAAVGEKIKDEVQAIIRQKFPATPIFIYSQDLKKII